MIRLMGRGDLNPVNPPPLLMRDFGRKQTGEKNKTIYFQRMSPEYYENSLRTSRIFPERYERRNVFFDILLVRFSKRRSKNDPGVIEYFGNRCTTDRRRSPNTSVRRWWSTQNFTTKCLSRRNYNTTTTIWPRSMFEIVSSGVVFGPPFGHRPGRAIRRERRGT